MPGGPDSEPGSARPESDAPVEEVDETEVSFPGGAALLRGSELWILAEYQPDRSLGPSMILGSRLVASSVNLVAEAGQGVLARRASRFSERPRVWVPGVDGLHEAVPEPDEPLAQARSDELAFESVIREAGAEPVVEDGILRAQVLGLEVARVGRDDRGPVLEVGVGRHDREAHRAVHGGDSPASLLANVVEHVRRHRRPGIAAHPANQLSTERWLRSVLVAMPETIGMEELEPVGTFVDLARPCPAPAVATDRTGNRWLVVASVGVDLDLVPTAADVRAAAELTAGPLSGTLVVLPRGDDHPATRALAARLREPPQILTVEPGWREIAC